MKFYVTFGQKHTHSVGGKTFDKDTVACYQADGWVDGRKKAFEYFGEEFFTTYSESEWNDNNLEFFPKGIVEL